MTPIVISFVAFVCMSAGAQLGMSMRAALPEHHLSAESKEAVRLGTGLIATLAALVLGLVIASAKRAFDDQDTSVRQTAADILELDSVLNDYGPETKACRDQIRRAVESQLARGWGERGLPAESDVSGDTRIIESIAAQFRALAPQTDAQRALQNRALSIADGLREARWLRLESRGDTIPTVFLVIVVFWLTVIFWSFGLFAPRNATVLAVFLVGALSAATAIFLILELEHPFDGIVTVSKDPLHYTLSHLGQ